MKLVSADFHPKDIEALKKWVALLQKRDKSITMKKYIKFCVTHMTQTLMDMRDKEIQKAAAKVASTLTNNSEENTNG